MEIKNPAEICGIFLLSEFFCHSQQQDAEDDHGDECVGLPGQLFFQEDPGKQQGDNTDRGEDGSGNSVHTTQGINIGELTFALFALGLFIFMKSKKVKFGAVPQHKDKILAAVFETAGQFTYVYALGGVDAVAAPILSSVCIVSLLLSRIFLKEKLNWKTYAFIAVVIIGILLLAVAEEL